MKALRTSYEAWRYQKLSINLLGGLKCLAYALVPEKQHKKLDVVCILLANHFESKSCDQYHPQTKHILLVEDHGLKDGGCVTFTLLSVLIKVKSGSTSFYSFH